MTMPVRRLGGVLSITLLSFSIAACGGSTPSAAPATQVTQPPASASPSVTPEATPTGSPEPSPGTSVATTGRIEVAQHGFAITLPDGWNRVDLSEGDLEAILEAAGDVDPALAQQYAGQIQALLAAGLAIFAFGPDAANGTNLTVLAIPGAGLSLDLLDQVNRAQLENLAAGEIETERITLPAGDAIHYRYALDVEGAGGATLDQFFVLAGSKQLVVTATNASEADVTAIVNSIEVLD